MSGLDRRVKQLEVAHSDTHAGADTIAERRARLTPYLADDTYYAGQREAILTALCEGVPANGELCYQVRQTHAAGEVMECAAFSLTMLDWSARDEGGEPTVTRFILPEPEQEPDYE